MSLDVAAIRREFPMLAKHINGKPVPWFGQRRKR